MNLFGGTEVGPRNSRIFLVPLTVLLSDSQFSKKNASTARRHEENYFLT